MYIYRTRRIFPGKLGKTRSHASPQENSRKYGRVGVRRIMLSFSHRRKISLPPLSLSGYNTQFFFPPIFSHVHSSLTGVLVRASVFPIDEERTRETGVEREDCVREWKREREREERGAGSSNLHIYSFTGIQSSLNSAEFVWMRGHRRRMCVATHELHPLFITLRRAWWSSEARTPHGPSPFLSLFLSLSFSVFTFLVFFSFFKPRSAPLLFSRMRREGLIPRSSETLHLSRGIVQFLTILRVFRRRCRYNLKGGREKLRMDGESNNLHFQCKDDAAG